MECPIGFTAESVIGLRGIRTEGCESNRVEDVVGGRGTVGLALIVPELLFEQDMMFRLEGRFIGTQSVTVAGRQGPFLGGAIGLEALMFF